MQYVRRKVGIWRSEVLCSACNAADDEQTNWFEYIRLIVAEQSRLFFSDLCIVHSC